MKMKDSDCGLKTTFKLLMEGLQLRSMIIYQTYIPQKRYQQLFLSSVSNKITTDILIIVKENECINLLVFQYCGNALVFKHINLPSLGL